MDKEKKKKMAILIGIIVVLAAVEIGAALLVNSYAGG